MPRPKAVRRAELARAIYDVIKEFGLIRGMPRTGLAHKIVSVIVKTITEALQRGETVRIHGLGTFKVRNRKAMGHEITYFDATRVALRTFTNLPSKQIVKFTPCDTILQELNHES